MWSNPAAAVAGHLAALKVELKITPDQDTAWQTFTTKARQQADTMIARHTQMSSQTPATTLSAPERLAHRTEFAKQRIAGMETMTAAVKDLYAVLTPEQKALADRQLAHGAMGGGGRGMGGGRGFRRRPALIVDHDRRLNPECRVRKGPAFFAPWWTVLQQRIV